MRSPLHQLSIISWFGEVEMCPQQKVGLFCGRVRLGGSGAPGGSVLSLGGVQAGGCPTCPGHALLPSAWHPPTSTLCEFGLHLKDLHFLCRKMRGWK